MATDISEAGLEKIISDYLVDVNGYEARQGCRVQ